MRERDALIAEQRESSYNRYYSAYSVPKSYGASPWELQPHSASKLRSSYISSLERHSVPHPCRTMSDTVGSHMSDSGCKYVSTVDHTHVSHPNNAPRSAVLRNALDKVQNPLSDLKEDIDDLDIPEKMLLDWKEFAYKFVMGVIYSLMSAFIVAKSSSFRRLLRKYFRIFAMVLGAAYVSSGALIVPVSMFLALLDSFTGLQTYNRTPSLYSWMTYVFTLTAGALRRSSAVYTTQCVHGAHHTVHAPKPPPTYSSHCTTHRGLIVPPVSAAADRQSDK